jgi:hypothetical protein
VEQKDILLNLLEANLLQACNNAVKVLNRYALITRQLAESALDLYYLVYNALQKQLLV